jgi:hypothetical protein
MVASDLEGNSVAATAAFEVSARWGDDTNARRPFASVSGLGDLLQLTFGPGDRVGGRLALLGHLATRDGIRLASRIFAAMLGGAVVLDSR